MKIVKAEVVDRKLLVVLYSSDLIWKITHTFILFQVRTLFVSGLPMDTKPRELYLLFRAYEVMCASHPSQPVLRINEARITTWI